MDDYIVVLLIIMIFIVIYVYREQLYRMTKRHDRKYRKTSKKQIAEIETSDDISAETFGDETNYDISDIDYSSKLSENNSMI
jgi:hypothetical protein